MLSTKRGVAAAFLCVLAGLETGCATPYQAKAFSGGYEESRVDETTYVVTFGGNGFTSRQKVDAYVQYRCAELTLAAGFDFYVVISGAADAASFVSGSYGGGVVTASSDSKPIATVQMKMYRGKKPDNPNAHDAREVQRFLAPQVER